MDSYQRISGDLRQSMVRQAEQLLGQYLRIETQTDSHQIAKIRASRGIVVANIVGQFQSAIRDGGVRGRVRDDLKEIVEEAARNLAFSRKEVRLHNGVPVYVGEPKDGMGPGPMYWVREQPTQQ